MTTIRSDDLNLTIPLDETSGGTGLSSYNTGDILYATGTNTLGKLPIGPIGTFFSSNGSSINWSPAVSGSISSETLNVTPVSQAVNPDVDYTFLNHNVDQGITSWATKIGGTGTTQGRCSTTDATGMYVAGTYTTFINIYNAGGGTFGGLTRTAGTDCFIVKYNTSGTGVWSAKILSTGNVIPYSITSDSTGIYIVGTYTANATIYNFNNSTFGTILHSAGNDSFIVKYDASGFAQWFARLINSNNVISYGVVSDGTSVYVSGSHNNDVSFFDSSGTLFQTIEIGVFSPQENSFILKLNTSGIGNWTARVSSSTFGVSVSDGVALDSSGVYMTIVVGGNGGNVNVHNSNDTVFGTLGSPGLFGGFNNNSYVIKYNTSGFVQWTLLLGTFVRSVSIASNNSGVYAVSYNPDTTYTYIHKCSSDGNLLWTIGINGTNQSPVGYENIIADDNGFYVTGYYNNASPIEIYNADGTLSRTLPATSGNDVFILRYYSTGELIWATRMSGTGDDRGIGISIGSSGLYVTGYYGSSLLTIYNIDGTTTTLDNTDGVSYAFIVNFENDGVLGLVSLGDRSSIGSKIINNINRGFVSMNVSNLIYNGVTATDILFILKGKSVELGWNGTEWFVIDNKKVIIS